MINSLIDLTNRLTLADKDEQCLRRTNNSARSLTHELEAQEIKPFSWNHTERKLWKRTTKAAFQTTRLNSILQDKDHALEHEMETNSYTLTFKLPLPKAMPHIWSTNMKKPKMVMQLG